MYPRLEDRPGRWRDRALGAALWGVIALTCLGGVGQAVANLGGRPRLAALGNYWLGRDPLLHREAAAGLLTVGDPVFYRWASGDWTQVGYVESVTPLPPPAGASPPTVRVSLRWHDRRLDPRAVQLVAHHNRGTLAEMLQVMFPAEKRLAIQQLIAAAMQQHGEVLAQRFLPLVKQGIVQSLPVLERELLASLERHREQTHQIGLRWREEILQQRLLPLAREQLLPIARKHTEPVMRQIGRELWDRASLWSFTWRAAYDRAPLPRRDLMRQEWERFIEEEAIPVIQAHREALVEAVQRTLADLSRSPAVREQLGAALSQMAADPQARALIGSVIRETLLDNQAMRRVWAELGESAETQAALDFASDLLAPLVRRIGEEMLGSPRRGIDPGLARVLRHQVLGKDRRWVVAHTAGQRPPGRRIIAGTGEPIYPVLHLAGEQEDG